jgi:hypothetical protein
MCHKPAIEKYESIAVLVGGNPGATAMRIFGKENGT